MNTTIDQNYDYCLQDLLEAPPLNHLDMVLALGKGEFVIEGNESNFQDAETYAQTYSEEKEVWQGMRLLDFEAID